MPEAGPESPGHVGHTPQPIVSMLIRDRMRGILTSTLALVTPREFAMQPFPQLQGFQQPGHIATLLSMEDANRRAAGPFTPRAPIQFRDAIVGDHPGTA